MEKELKQIDDAIQENIPEHTDDDKAAYEIPKNDEGYLKVLKERFGHDSFKEGQLEAIKIILEKKENALVVLATGGGKSLIYQFTT
jgi:ATP-dependent DNA helicase Q4